MLTLTRSVLAIAVAAGALTVAGCGSPSPSMDTPPSGLQALQSPRVTMRPLGAGFTPFESLPAQPTLRDSIAEAPPGTTLSFGPGTFSFADFTSAGDSTYNGIAFPATTTGIAGSGVGRTVFTMQPGTSTSAGLIPTTFPHTNQLSLLRASGSVTKMSGFTLQGTDQGHLYNGLRLSHLTGLTMHDVLVRDIPGDDGIPPGETFGINDFRSTGSRYTRVEVDGGGIGAAGFGANSSSGITLDRCSFHDNRYSAGATFYQVHDIDIIDSSAEHNGQAGFNFERSTGSIRIVGSALRDNSHGDIRVASDLGSIAVTIVDPVFEGSAFTVVLPSTYAGRPNLQRAADVHLIVHGVDRSSDLLRFVSK